MDQFEDQQAEVPDLQKLHDEIGSALRCAADCETAGDFQANISDAITYARQLLADLLILQD
jgi:hypothetical protein